MRPRLVYSPQYTMDWGKHVFPVEKYRLTYERLLARGIARPDDFEAPAPATDDELRTVHTAAYLRALEAMTADPRLGYAMFEAPCTREVVEKFKLATGGTILAARRAIERGAAANLSGGFHHAFADRGEGFCLLNDLAVAIRVLQRKGGIRRAAVIDLDLHQGNGTARIFAGDADVYTFSIHQERNYPVKERSTWDIGLDDGAGDDEYLAHVARAVPRILDEHRPDLVLYQAGADPYERDQLGGLKLTKAGLRRRDELVLGACRDRAVPVAVTLGGGYPPDVADVVEIQAATVEALLAAPAGAAP